MTTFSRTHRGFPLTSIIVYATSFAEDYVTSQTDDVQKTQEQGEWSSGMIPRLGLRT